MGESIVEAETLKACQKKIDKLLKPKVRIRAFYSDRWNRDWEDPKLLEEVEITSRATESNYFWVVAVKTKTRRKVNVQDLLKYNKEEADKIFSLNQTIKKSLDEVENLKDKSRYSREELFKLLEGDDKNENDI